MSINFTISQTLKIAACQEAVREDSISAEYWGRDQLSKPGDALQVQYTVVKFLKNLADLYAGYKNGEVKLSTVRSSQRYLTLLLEKVDLVVSATPEDVAQQRMILESTLPEAQKWDLVQYDFKSLGEHIEGELTRLGKKVAEDRALAFKQYLYTRSV